MSFKDDIEQLAGVVAKHATSAEGVTFGERIEALRTLIQYHKDVVAKEKPPEDDNVFSIKAAQKAVRAVNGEDE